MYMAKKYYVLIASCLRKTKPPKSDVGYLQWYKDVNSLADAFGEENEKFNRKIFESACGIGE